jgi:rhodanese-related sulfurtransferase
MDKGFRRVRPLEGGIEAWIEAGYGVVTRSDEKEDERRVH